MMSILAAWCLTLCMSAVEGTTSENSTPSAWIAVLRDYERQHGRDAWSFQELSEARAAVLDPYFAVKPSSGWFHQLNILYFTYYPVVLLALCVLCGAMAWKYHRRQQWSRMLIVNLIWFMLLGAALLPLQQTFATAVIIKLQGVALREGNGLTYPETIRGQTHLSLAAGVEAKLVAEVPNGWVKIQLVDGTAGWVPTDAVYLVR